ncbi:hypothetical protein BDV95DRAFT_598756 [Massariosphaeria phaeospora]|uniref:Uncharacterized protein n=1 Tax=Massariosphaeria phaeospora TaxID=100035 RepID=A0A7C8M3I1_9PLEO|nr:hypothetical protein BDV95DRAFT_598756 [Massariosphaeria phaeospora]
MSMSPHHIAHRRQARSSTAPNPASTQTPTSTRSNLGPLTTTFIAPSHCSGAVLACPTCSKAFQAQTCKSGPNASGAEDDSECWPPTTVSEKRPPLAGFGFYSPGIACPMGYTTACSAVSQAVQQTTSAVRVVPVALQGGKFQFPLVAGETAVGCCPTGYSCATHTQFGWQTCHHIATSTKIAAVSCEEGAKDGIGALDVPFVAASTTITKMDLWAPMIQINWQTTDRSNTEVNKAEKTSSTSAHRIQLPATATPISSPDAATPPQSPQMNQGLSSSTTAGIAVSVVILTLCAVSILVYFLIRKRYLVTPTRFLPVKGENKSSTSSIDGDKVSGNGKIHTMAAFSTPLTNDSVQPRSLEYETGSGNGHARMATIDKTGRIALDTDIARFGRTLGVEDSLESPIDGTSPFRLKRGNTFQRAKSVGHNHKKSMKAEIINSASQDSSSKLRTTSLLSGEVTNSTDMSMRRSQSLNRDDSFSRPRLRAGTESSQKSANEKKVEEALARAYSLNRERSFSRPLRPQKSMATLRSHSEREPSV